MATSYIIPPNAGNAGAATVKSLSAVNANDIKTSGLYSCTGTSNTNLPNGATNGFLIVIKYAGSDAKQVFFRYGTLGNNDHEVYTRTFQDGEWGDWYQIFTEKGGTFNNAHLYFKNNDGNRIFRLQQAYGQVYFQTYDPDHEGHYTNFRLPKSLYDDNAYDIYCSAPTSPFFYQPAGTFTSNGSSSATYRPILIGLVSSDQKTIYVDVAVNKSMAAITSVAVTSLTGAIYGINGVVDGSTTSTDWTSTGYSLDAKKATNSHVRIAITKSNSGTFSNTTAATPVVFSAYVVLTFA